MVNYLVNGLTADAKRNVQHTSVRFQPGKELGATANCHSSCPDSLELAMASLEARSFCRHCHCNLRDPEALYLVQSLPASSKSSFVFRLKKVNNSGSTARKDSTGKYLTRRCSNGAETFLAPLFNARMQAWMVESR